MPQSECRLGRCCLSEQVDQVAIVVDGVAIVVDSVVLESGPDRVGDLTDVLPHDGRVEDALVAEQVVAADDRLALVHAAHDEPHAGEVEHGVLPWLVKAGRVCVGDLDDPEQDHPACQAVGLGVGGLGRAVMPAQQERWELAEGLEAVELPLDVPVACEQGAGSEAELAERGHLHVAFPLHDLAEHEPGIVLVREEVRGDGQRIFIDWRAVEITLHHEQARLVERCRGRDKRDEREGVDRLARAFVDFQKYDGCGVETPQIELHGFSLRRDMRHHMLTYIYIKVNNSYNPTPITILLYMMFIKRPKKEEKK